MNLLLSGGVVWLVVGMAISFMLRFYLGDAEGKARNMDVIRMTIVNMVWPFLLVGFVLFAINLVLAPIADWLREPRVKTKPVT